MEFILPYLLKERGVCFSDDVSLRCPTCRYEDGGRQTGLAAPLSGDADGVQHTRRQAPQGVRLGARRDFLLGLVAVRRHVDDSENVELGQGALPLQHQHGFLHLGGRQFLGSVER